MIKQNKLTLIITSIIILLPMLAGVILWDMLPQEIPTHFAIDGTPDQYSSKAFTVFFFPIFFLFIHWLCTIATSFDPKVKNISKKPITLVLMICPALSILVHTIMYLYVLGINIDIPLVMCLFFGVLFVIIGNYLPKCKQNHTIGIRIPWTLNDEENWNKTHRFCGVLWTIAGVIIFILAILKLYVLFFVVVAIMTIAPIIYSFILYKKSLK